MFLQNYRQDPNGSPASRGFPGRPAPPSPRAYKNFLLYDNHPAGQAPRRAFQGAGQGECGNPPLFSRGAGGIIFKSGKSFQPVFHY